MKMRCFVTVSVIISALSATCLAGEVSKEDLKRLEDQITALRSGSIQSNGGAAEAVVAVQELQTQMESIKASIDANAHAIKAATDNMNLKLSDVDARVAGLEEQLAIQGKQVTSAVSSVAPEAAKEAELYQAGLNQVNNSEFLKAVATFKKFMKSFPKSDYVANAQYWIGECYFTMKDYEQAIKEFQILMEKYKRSDRVPTAMLKQGYAFNELGMESDAKLFLNTVIQKYPSTKESKEAKDWLKRWDEQKKSDADKKAMAGQVPLASGVVVPDKKDDKSKNNANEKYR